MLETAVQAAEILACRGNAISVLSMPTVQPLDVSAVVDAARRTPRIVTIEEHGFGGLGSAVAEVLAQSDGRVTFRMLRLERQAISTAGSQQFLRDTHGLSVEDIVRSVEQ
jgi:transketolase